MSPKAKLRASIKSPAAGNGAVAALHLKNTEKIVDATRNETNLALSKNCCTEAHVSRRSSSVASVVSADDSSKDTKETSEVSTSQATLETPYANHASNILVRRVERLLHDCLSNASGYGDGGVDFRILEIAVLDARELDGVDADLLERAEIVLEQSCGREAQADSFEEPEHVLERLFDAINDGCIDIVESCLDANAGNPLQLQVDVVDYEGNTPLSVAACYGETSIVELLLKRKAHPDTRNDKGRTPLWRACYNGHLPVIEVLLNNGADKTIPNHLQEEPGKYGTPESRSFVNNWDDSLTLKVRNKIGLKELEDNSRSQQLIRRVSEFTSCNPRALGGDGTGQLVDMLLWDRDKEHKRGDLIRRFQDHSNLDVSCPEYPMKIGLKQLNAALLLAHRFGKTPLVVCNGLDQPDRFLIYSCECVVDAKQLLAELHFRKSKTLGEIQEDLKHKLLASMETHGIGLSLHIRMGDSACDFKDTFCAPNMFPVEVFGGSSAWNSDVARKHFPTGDVIVQPDFRIAHQTNYQGAKALTELISTNL